MPFSINFSRKAKSSIPESFSHPDVAINPFLTSAPKMIRSGPYFSKQMSNRSGSLTAKLPRVICAAPDSKAKSISSFDFKPPPKSSFKLVLELISFKTGALHMCFERAPSRSTRCSCLIPAFSNVLATFNGFLS